MKMYEIYIMNLLLVKRKIFSVMGIQKHIARVMMSLATVTKIMIFRTRVSIRKVSLHVTNLIKIFVLMMSINT